MTNPQDNTPELVDTGLLAAAKPAPEVPAAQEQAVNPDREIVIKDESQLRKENFLAQVNAIRNKPVENYTPPPPTARQLSQTEREIAAGRKRVAFHEQQKAHRPPMPAPTPTEAKTVPVFRPADYVPNMNQGNVGAKTLSE